VIGAINALARPLDRLEPDERTLSVLETKEDDANQPSEVLSLADPEHAVPLEGLIDEFQPSSELPADRGSALLGILGIALVIAALAAMWRWTPLSSFANGAAVVDLARRTADSPWTIPALIAGYVVATFVMFPRPLLTVFGVLAYRPWLGFTLAMIGILAATVANYLVGRRLPRRLVRRFAGPSLNRVMAVLRSRGVLAMTALRLVPIAPFAVPGIVAGAAHLRLREVLLGTAMGNLPGILLTTVLADRLEAVLRDPRPEDFWLLAGVLLLAAVAAYSLRRSLSRIQLPTRPG
jgi:uncharacterized membrane protein YdjX (TVP38/TMEM64 family)